MIPSLLVKSKNKEFKNINPINDNATCEDFSLSFLPKKINIIKDSRGKIKNNRGDNREINICISSSIILSSPELY